MSKKNKSGLVVFIIVLVLVVIVSVAGYLGSNNKFSNSIPSFHLKSKTNPIINVITPNKKNTTPKPKTKFISCLEIKGTIEQGNSSYNQQWILQTIKNLKDDNKNVGLILLINSPGGGVYEADEVYLKLLDYKSSGKPIYAYLGSLAASGGYYIACAADIIYANRNTLTGSIGVLAGGSLDLTELMKNLGIKYTVIHAGKNKNMGNYNESLTDEQVAILQGIADECYDQFTTIVSDSRKMSKDKVIKLADGRIYTARQAYDNGLVDYIGSFEDAVSHMERTQFLGEKYEVINYFYEQKQNFYNYLLGAVSSFSKTTLGSTIIPEVVLNAISSKTPFPAYYYDSGR